MFAMFSVKIGERFQSLVDLECEIQRYQNENFVQLTLRDTRMLENAKKRAPKRVEGAKTTSDTTPCISHASVVAKKYKSKGQGTRPCQQ